MQKERKPLTGGQRLSMKLRGLLIPSGPHGDARRGALYRPHLLSCGENFKVAEQAFIYSPEKLRAGDHVYVGFCSYLGNGPIALEDEVLIGNHVSITAANHLEKDKSFRFGGSELKEVRIGRGTWIAAHACITAGVSIGAGSLVAAGAVVTRDFGDRLVIGGVPAKVIGHLDDAGNIHRIDD